jgi:hypothetical protein
VARGEISTLSVLANATDESFLRPLLQTTSPAFLARISPSSTSMPLSHATMPTLPTEIVSKIINHYFHTDTPSTPLHLCDIVLPHAASLRLVHSTFRAIIDDAHLLCRSVTLVTPKDWLRYFSTKDGVLLDGIQGLRQTSWVREVSLCFENPSFPLRHDITEGEVTANPDQFDAIGWFQRLFMPSFSPAVRFINILPPPSPFPAYEGKLFQLAMDAHVREQGGMLSSEEEEEEYDEELFFNLHQVKSHVTIFFLQPLFLGRWHHPIQYDSISLLDLNVTQLLEQFFSSRTEMFFGIFADDEGLPIDLCSQIDVLPTFYIYPSSLHPCRSTSRPPPIMDEKRWLTLEPVGGGEPVYSPMWKNPYFKNVRLVQYVIGSPLRAALQEELRKVEAQATEEQKEVLAGWRWLEEDGELTEIVKRGQITA